MTHSRPSIPVVPLEQIAPLIERAREVAREYMELTGKPLGITGEVAEFEAARLLDLQLVDARQPGHDALRGAERLQIKGRAIRNPARCGSQRLGSIKLAHEWDAVLMILMDIDFRAYEIWEATREAIAEALAVPGSEARKRGALSVSKFKQIGKLMWRTFGGGAGP